MKPYGFLLCALTIRVNSSSQPDFYLFATLSIYVDFLLMRMGFFVIPRLIKKGWNIKQKNT